MDLRAQRHALRRPVAFGRSRILETVFYNDSVDQQSGLDRLAHILKRRARHSISEQAFRSALLCYTTKQTSRKLRRHLRSGQFCHHTHASAPCGADDDDLSGRDLSQFGNESESLWAVDGLAEYGVILLRMVDVVGQGF